MHWSDYLATNMREEKTITVPETGEKVNVFPMVYTKDISICGTTYERGEVAFWTDSTKNLEKSIYPSYLGEKTYLIRSTVSGSNAFGPRTKDLFIIDSYVSTSYFDNRDTENNGVIIDSSIIATVIETANLFLRNVHLKECALRGFVFAMPTKPDAKIILQGFKVVDAIFKNEETVCYFNEYYDVSVGKDRSLIPILETYIYSQKDFAFGMCEIKKNPKPDDCWSIIATFSKNKELQYSLFIPKMNAPIECTKFTKCVHRFVEYMAELFQLPKELDEKNIAVKYLLEQNGLEKEAAKILAKTFQDEMIAYADLAGLVCFLMFVKGEDYKKYLSDNSTVDIFTRKFIGFNNRFRLKRYAQQCAGIDFPTL